MDTAFKKLADPEKLEELNTEMERQKAWDEFNQQMGEDWKKMYDDLLTTIQCSVCQQRHKKNLIKDRSCFSARYFYCCCVLFLSQVLKISFKNVPNLRKPIYFDANYLLHVSVTIHLNVENCRVSTKNLRGRHFFYKTN